MQCCKLGPVHVILALHHLSSIPRLLAVSSLTFSGAPTSRSGARGIFFLLGSHRGKHLDIPGEVVRGQIFGVEGESKLPEETFNSGVITHSSDLEVAWLLCQLRFGFSCGL